MECYDGESISKLSAEPTKRRHVPTRSNMNQSEIDQIVLDSLVMCNNARPDADQIPISTETQLFGANGHLDSMGLVGLLLDIEDVLIDKGYDITLSDEKAMSEKKSPFRDVATLSRYIAQQLATAE